MIQRQKERERLENLKKNERTLQELSDFIRRNNIRVIVIPEVDEREKRSDGLFKKIISENFSNKYRHSNIRR